MKRKQQKSQKGIQYTLSFFVNRPLRFHNCPLCKLQLVKDKKKKSTFVCPKCGLHISPNRKKRKI